MALILSADTIRQYNKAFPNLKDDTILPFVEDATDKYLLPWLGKTQLAEIDNYVENGASGDTELDALLHYVQRALSRFVLHEASPSMDINLGETGFTTKGSGDFVPASQQRVQKYNESLLKLGWQNIESMLKFLEDNIDDYPLWENSDAYTRATDNFIMYASDFQQYVDISHSRMFFQKLRPIMDQVEKFQIYPVISSELGEAIKDQIRAGTVSTENQKILDAVKPAVALLAMADDRVDLRDEIQYVVQTTIDAAKKSKYNWMGTFYLGKAESILYATPTDYPLFTNSDVYDEDKTTNDLYENDEDDKVVGLGSIPT